MTTPTPTLLLFRFPSAGPWGRDLTDHARALARDIAVEPGLIWKIWLEDQRRGRAGGVYLFEDAAAAERYRAKHERRLSAMGLVGIATDAFSVNRELSVLTMASAALDLAWVPNRPFDARNRRDLGTMNLERAGFSNGARPSRRRR